MKRCYIIEVMLNNEKIYYQSRDLSCFVDDPLKAEQFASKKEAASYCSSGNEIVRAV